jgi:hypothetical protein
LQLLLLVLSNKERIIMQIFLGVSREEYRLIQQKKTVKE